MKRLPVCCASSLLCSDAKTLFPLLKQKPLHLRSAFSYQSNASAQRRRSIRQQQVNRYENPMPHDACGNVNTHFGHHYHPQPTEKLSPAVVILTSFIPCRHDRYTIASCLPNGRCIVVCNCWSVFLGYSDGYNRSREENGITSALLSAL